MEQACISVSWDAHHRQIRIWGPEVGSAVETGLVLDKSQRQEVAEYRVMVFTKCIAQTEDTGLEKLVYRGSQSFLSSLCLLDGRTAVWLYL